MWMLLSGNGSPQSLADVLKSYGIMVSYLMTIILGCHRMAFQAKTISMADI